uniref:Thyroglobulin type-1 domain-containing protein n=1 Tax=Ascaris lumbricoides TaxID=6252 RepID=A0A9J2Q468_ASCLU
TACIHEAITAEAYSAIRKRKCDENGKFRQIQCDLRGCFCVDIENGNEIANTRVAINENPRCDEKRLFCESVICPKKCAYGFEVSSDGCALCECRNPCNDVHCPSGRFCVMSDVQCFQQSYCPQQPRCDAIRKRKCDENGKFRQIQCDLRGCFCVDIENGNEIANTRVAINENPRCDEKRLFCESVICPKKCAYGFEVSSDGCALCECRNPCNDVHCPSGRFCVMSDVQCFQQSYCPQQPRCVVNVCPSGSPFSSLLVTQVDLCGRDADCPTGYWCNRVGVNANKGMCCLEPKRRSNNARCPVVVPLIDGETERCKIWCRSDEECDSSEKCCYDGCGLRCITIEAITTSTESMSVSSITNVDRNPSAIGQCASYTIRNDCEPSHKDTCTHDADCPYLQKCCNTGCVKTCVYPYRTTGCLHLKVALQKISSRVSARCKEDGAFESIQCDEKYCWCVLKDGTEIDGTRITNDRSPNCECMIPFSHNFQRDTLIVTN